MLSNLATPGFDVTCASVKAILRLNVVTFSFVTKSIMLCVLSAVLKYTLEYALSSLTVEIYIFGSCLWSFVKLSTHFFVIVIWPLFLVLSHVYASFSCLSSNGQISSLFNVTFPSSKTSTIFSSSSKTNETSSVFGASISFKKYVPLSKFVNSTIPVPSTEITSSS